MKKDLMDDEYDSAHAVLGELALMMKRRRIEDMLHDKQHSAPGKAYSGKDEKKDPKKKDDDDDDYKMNDDDKSFMKGGPKKSKSKGMMIVASMDKKGKGKAKGKKNSKRYAA